MDNLHSILSTFSEDEKKALSAFVQRQKIKQQRKDLQLLALLSEEDQYTGEELLLKLYPKSQNQVAYHALRRRLMQHIIDFITLERSTNTTIEGTAIMGLLSLCQYLFEVSLDKLAWKYLLKAEKTALQDEQYALLNVVYNLALSHTSSEFAPSFEKLLSKRNQNKILAEEDERAHIANCIIKEKLTKAKLEGQQLDFDEISQTILREWNLEKALNQRPKLRYNLLSIARSAVVAKKDYYKFEPFLRKNYQEFLSFSKDKPSMYYQLSMLYMLSHVLYRNKKFEESISYLHQFKKLLDDSSKSFQHTFHAKWALLMAANFAFTNQRQQAIELIDKLLKQKTIATKDYLNAKLNLVFYHFQVGNFRQANRVIVEFEHSDTWCEKKMGKEWLVKKWLIEATLQFELQNDDIARKIIAKIKRNYNVLLSSYQNSLPFLSLLEEFMRYPQRATQKDFADKVDNLLIFAASTEQEDLQEMAFYAWLKSKMQKQNYYEVLIELIGTASIQDKI